jgi:mannan endo-1,4-beta-mannosidase
MKRAGVLCWVALLIALGSPMSSYAAPPAQTTSTWTGQYFSNPNLQGTPSLTRPDVAIDFNWGTGSPDLNLPPDNFSVRWERWLLIDTTGDWTFTLVSDNGAVLHRR